MPEKNSNLSNVDRKQATTTKRKKDNAAAASKTLDEAWAREHAAALAWEKEKTITRHLEQQSTAAQWITLP
jgi:hypothetical protein